MQIDLSLVPELVHRQHHVDIDHVVEVPRDAIELGDDVIAERGRDVEVVAGQVQVHLTLLI